MANSMLCTLVMVCGGSAVWIENSTNNGMVVPTITYHTIHSNGRNAKLMGGETFSRSKMNEQMSISLAHAHGHHCCQNCNNCE